MKTANPSTKIARLAAEAASSRAEAAGTWADPFLGAGLDEVPFGSQSGAMLQGALGVSVPFPGKTGALSRAARAAASAASHDATTAARLAQILAAQFYARDVFARRELALVGETLGLVRQSAESARARYQAGETGVAPWLASRIELASLDADRLRLELEVENLDSLLNELRGEAPSTPIALATSLPSLPHEEPGGPLPSSELVSADARLVAAREETRSSVLSYFPDLSLQAMVMRPAMSGMGQPASWGFLAGITLPIFFFSRQGPLLAAARVEAEAAEVTRDSLARRLEAEAGRAIRERESARRRVKLYESEAIPTTEIAVREARLAYSHRRGPLADLIATLRARRTQFVELAAARLDLLIAELRIREPLADPPLFRLAPARPTFIGGGMGSARMEGMASEDVPPVAPARPATPGAAPAPVGGMEGM